jgi:dTDP-4-dehydrorhamnose reductase
MRVAVTGAGGRLGSSIVRLLQASGSATEALAWDLPDHDLDDPASAAGLVAAGRPDVVIHCAAWTDVDGCARDPELAMRRNGLATGELAEACVAAGTSLIAISTNEVFDGRRTDRVPYAPADAPNPANPYGAAKLHGERLARAAFGEDGPGFATAAVAATGGEWRSPEAPGEHAGPQLAIVRTAWLFGPPGLDFPRKILASARKAQAAGTELLLVSDEVGCPTYAPDLAASIVALVEASAGPAGRTFRGIHHVVNGGSTSRAGWARQVLDLARIALPTRDVSLRTWPRPSTPPLWGVLGPTPLPGGPLRGWTSALEQYMAELGAEEKQ